MIVDRENDPASVLMQLARDTEQLAMFERRNFSPVLRRWHPAPVAVAAVTLHGCFGVVLRQYLARVTILTEELVRVLHSASRLEKALAQMTAEDAADCDDGRAKAVVGDMEPFEVESVVMGLLKAWMDDKLGLAKDCVLRARDTEVLSTQTGTSTASWNFANYSIGELTNVRVCFAELDSEVERRALCGVRHGADEAGKVHHRRVLRDPGERERGGGPRPHRRPRGDLPGLHLLRGVLR